MPAYIERLADPMIDQLLTELPALMLTGPRAAGKTTTALRHSAGSVRLDQTARVEAYRLDPDAALANLAEPALLDEWQQAPEVLGAVKRAVDSDPHPGRFLLTGSARADMSAETWPGTGRVVRLPIFPMTVREAKGRVSHEAFVDRLTHPSLDNLGPADDANLNDYIDLALAGGFPEAMTRSAGTAREMWLESYIDQLVTRDVASLSPRRDPAKIRTFFSVLAVNTAGTVADATLFDAAGINRETASAYLQLLTNLYVLDTVPAWSANRLAQFTHLPKRYLIDPALVGALLRADRAGVINDPDLLGRLLDTFVATQIRPELTLSQARPRMFHIRDKGGRHEVDLVLEYGARRLVGIEIKANAKPTSQAAQHLRWLRDLVGDRFACGVVLHTGDQAFQVDTNIFAAPISTLWA